VLGDESGAVAIDPEADNVPDIEDGPPVTRRGDLWLLGPHRLLCADARDPESYRQILPDRRAHVAVTDPPFNVAIDGHARGLGQHRHPDFVMASGELSETEFIGFLETVFRIMAGISVPGAVHFTFMDWRHLYEILSAGRGTYDVLLNVCVWANPPVRTPDRNQGASFWVGPQLRGGEIGPERRWPSLTSLRTAVGAQGANLMKRRTESLGLKQRLKKASTEDRKALVDGLPYEVGFGKLPPQLRPTLTTLRVIV
jgi:hypothetical protein